MRLTGSYFELTDRFADRRSGKAPASAPAERQDTGDGRDRLLISVAKRLVKSAVRRNTVKRIVREAWRAATDKGIAQQVSQASERRDESQRDDGLSRDGQRDGVGTAPARVVVGTVIDRVPSRSCLVRLKRYPGAGADPKPGFKMIKRSLRQDADQLFMTYLAKRK